MQGYIKWAVVAVVVGGWSSPASGQVRVLVPAYFAVPEGKTNWEKLIAAHRAESSEILAIANVGQGAGTKINGGPLIPPGWDVAVTQQFYGEWLPRASTRGVRVLGYVSTQYGKRPIADAKADISAWKKSWKGVSGIFFDEQAQGTPQDPDWAKKSLPYYQELAQTARAAFGPHTLIVTNPGSVGSTPEDLEPYVKPGKNGVAADVMVLQEGTDLAKYQPPAFVKKYAPQRFAGLVHQTKNLDLLAVAMQKRLGNIYLTDDGADGNPWDRLPTYWPQEIEQIRKMNK